MNYFNFLKAFLKARRSQLMQQDVVVICVKRQAHARVAVTQEGFDCLLRRLQKVADQFPAAAYDGLERKGDEVRLYFFSNSAQPLARALAFALSEVSWCKGAIVGVCSDIGFRLGEYAVP